MPHTTAPMGSLTGMDVRAIGPQDDEVGLLARLE
jgi:hypothetical protein